MIAECHQIKGLAQAWWGLGDHCETGLLIYRCLARSHRFNYMYMVGQGNSILVKNDPLYWYLYAPQHFNESKIRCSVMQFTTLWVQLTCGGGLTCC